MIMITMAVMMGRCMTSMMKISLSNYLNISVEIRLAEMMIATVTTVTTIMTMDIRISKRKYFIRSEQSEQVLGTIFNQVQKSEIETSFSGKFPTSSQPLSFLTNRPY